MTSAQVAHAHMLNATRITVYFTEGKEFAADVYVDFAQAGISYEEYHALSGMSADDRTAALAPLHAMLLQAIAFHFDGWPVDMVVHDTELPPGDLEFYLDYYQPKMTRVRLVSERPRDSVVFSITTSEEAPFEFPLMMRIEMPGSEVPSSGIVGDQGMSSLPFVLQLSPAESQDREDALLTWVVGMGKGVARATSSWFPHQSELALAVFFWVMFAFSVERAGRQTVLLFSGGALVALVGMSLPPPMAVAVVSPYLASVGLLAVALSLAFSNAVRGGLPAFFAGGLSGGGLWQMAAPGERIIPGYSFGYGTTVWVVVILIGTSAALVASLFPNAMARANRFDFPRIVGGGLAALALVWLLQEILSR